jgi:hypothetical protein
MAVHRTLSEGGVTDAWKYVGEVTRTGDGSLEFPKVPNVHGLYKFLVTQGTKVIVGYVGQAAGREGFAQRFGNYKRRAVSPRDQRGNRIPVASRDNQLGTTSLNARRMLRALTANQTVSVFIIDDPALADDAELDAAETHEIDQLCRSGIPVWNIKKLPVWYRKKYYATEDELNEVEVIEPGDLVIELCDGDGPPRIYTEPEPPTAPLRP